MSSAESPRTARIDHAPRKGKPPRIALAGEAIDIRAAGVGEAEELADLVEGLAGGIVACLPEQAVTAKPFNLDQHGVAKRI